MEFDPLHWDLRGDFEPDDEYVPFKDIMLNHPWLAATE